MLQAEEVELVQDFREALSGLTEREARYEAQRFLFCGNCFERYDCYGI